MIKSKARSPLSATIGRGDKFRSYPDLIAGAREHVVRIDHDTFPTIHIEEQPNSWLIDYLLHGQMNFLTQDNHLTPGESFKLVACMVATLDQIMVCLDKSCPLNERDGVTPSDIVRRTMGELSRELKSRSKVNKSAGDV